MSIPDLVQQALQRVNERLRAVIAALEEFLAQLANTVRDICKSIARFVWNSLRQLGRTIWYLLILGSVFLAPLFIGSGFHELTFWGSWIAKAVGWIGTVVTGILLLVMVALLISHKKSSSEERKQTTVWFHLINIITILALVVGSHYDYKFRSPILEWTQASINLLFNKIQQSILWFSKDHRGGVTLHLVTASFDCKKAKTATEIAICSDPRLASLDLTMVSAYREVLDHLGPDEKSAFKRQHLEWFKQYQKTCNTVAQAGISATLQECISKFLSEHAKELQTRINNHNSSSSLGSAMPVANFLLGTHWHGYVGRSPAFLDIFNPDGKGNVNARVNYTGIVEDLIVTTDLDGTLVLRGTGYHRENGVGSFALDAFHGTVSGEGQQIQGWLLDGLGQRGNWIVNRAMHDPEAMISSTVDRLSPASAAITHWQGSVGSWPATFDILPRKEMGGWTACVTYRGVIESLQISVKEDGSFVLAGTSYRRLNGEGTVLLDTFYGSLSSDSQIIGGLRIDEKSRGQWKASRVEFSDHAQPPCVG